MVKQKEITLKIIMYNEVFSKSYSTFYISFSSFFSPKCKSISIKTTFKNYSY